MQINSDERLIAEIHEENEETDENVDEYSKNDVEILTDRYITLQFEALFYLYK